MNLSRRKKISSAFLGFSDLRIKVIPERLTGENQTEVNNMYIWKRPRIMEKCVKMAETLILKYYL